MSTTLRPSSLPKLAQCAKYQSEDEAGKYADRGTELDKLYRFKLGGAPSDHLTEWDDETLRGVDWAVQTTQIMAGGAAIISNEAELKVEFLGMSGTADAAAPTVNISFDLKTGEERDYYSQQAAYAGGMMEKYFAEEWKIYLLYSDLRRVETVTFTLEEAAQAVRDVVASVLDPLATATPCEYCDWCKLRYTCQARLEGVAFWAGKDPATLNFEEEFKDPEKLSQFLQMCHVIAKDGGLSDHWRAKALEMINAGTPVPGFTKASRNGEEFVSPFNVGHVIQDLGFGPVLEAYGRLSGKKFREVWAKKKGDKPIPNGLIESAPGYSYLLILPKKKDKSQTKTPRKTTKTKKK